MNAPLQYAFRFAVIVLVAALIPLVVAPPSAPVGPYLSALSDVTAGQVLAASGSCSYKACPKEPGRKSNCGKTTSFLNCVVSPMSGCASVSC